MTTSIGQIISVTVLPAAKNLLTKEERHTLMEQLNKQLPNVRWKTGHFPAASWNFYEKIEEIIRWGFSDLQSTTAPESLVSTVSKGAEGIRNTKDRFLFLFACHVVIHRAHLSWRGIDKVLSWGWAQIIEDKEDFRLADAHRIQALLAPLCSSAHLTEPLLEKLEGNLIDFRKRIVHEVKGIYEAWKTGENIAERIENAREILHVYQNLYFHILTGEEKFEESEDCSDQEAHVFLAVQSYRIRRALELVAKGNEEELTQPLNESREEKTKRIFTPCLQVSSQLILILEVMEEWPLIFPATPCSSMEEITQALKDWKVVATFPESILGSEGVFKKYARKIEEMEYSCLDQKRRRYLSLYLVIQGFDLLVRNLVTSPAGGLSAASKEAFLELHNHRGYLHHRLEPNSPLLTEEGPLKEILEFRKELVEKWISFHPLYPFEQRETKEAIEQYYERSDAERAAFNKRKREK